MRPMKYIGNGLMALTLSILLNYLLIGLLMRDKKSDTEALIGAPTGRIDHKNDSERVLSRVGKFSMGLLLGRIILFVLRIAFSLLAEGGGGGGGSSSSGGGGSSHSGGGGGGGGHSGGGGSHRF